MHLAVQFDLDLALDLQAGRATPATRKVLQLMEEFGASLRPVHPAATHPLLAPHFVVEAPNAQVADQLIARLLSSSGVTAAYVEPPIPPP